MGSKPNKRRRLGPFSVPEILVAGFVLLVLAAGASPRLGSASEDIAGAALAGNLAVLRNGLELYAKDHDGKFPTLAQFERQMTYYTDVAGNSATLASPSHPMGPYLRRVPVLTLGPKGFKGSAALVDAGKYAPGAVSGGWTYNASTGEIRANLPATMRDEAGKPYNRY